MSNQLSWLPWRRSEDFQWGFASGLLLGAAGVWLVMAVMLANR